MQLIFGKFFSGLAKMIKKPLASLLFLALISLSTLSLADTNAAGDEITVTGPSDSAVDDPDISTPGNNGLQTVPQLRNAPEAPLTSAESNDLLQRIRNGFGMESLESPLTANHESWYAARPDYIKRMMGRSQRYLYHVVEEVQKRGMPTEVALLPMVESAFNPTAYSSGKAAGIWQFIPSTGKNFGLKQNWWMDNRRDVTAATDAALNYLEKLHVMFGTWELALAAYNAGEGTVQRAIESNRKKGLPTDYQSLPLPPETRNYVPKLQAVKNIVSNPEQFGLNIAPIPDQPYFTKVEAPAKIDVSLAAKLAGISVDEFTALNPAHNRPVLASMDAKQEILLPLGKDEEFTANLANYNKPLVSWQTYQAKRGERLDKISSKFGISVAQLRDVNDLPAKGRLTPNQPLLVPAQGNTPAGAAQIALAEPAPVASVATSAPEVTHYRVKKGDNINNIAKRYHTTTKQLLAMNGLKNQRLHNGQVLVVAGGTAGKPAKTTTKVAGSSVNKPAKTPAKVASAKGKTHYTVKRGETLTSIAKKHKVAASDLQRWNNLNSKHNLVPGRTLVILKDEA
jgi:membrane-bound lytic murein transglycosylase D